MQNSRRHFLRTTVAAMVARVVPAFAKASAATPNALGRESKLATQSDGKRAASGYRSLFDGKTLTGWHAVARIGVPKSISLADTPPDQLRQIVMADAEKKAVTPAQKARVHHTGHWEAVDGVLTGGREPADSGFGAYLMTDEVFGEFELELDARPDWPADTGVLIREHELGSIGFQINVDHRPDGAMGGVFGNGIGSFRAAPFSINADELPGFRIANLREGGPEPQFPIPKMNYAATFADFKRVWRLNDWNHFRIRCVGAELPLITTWINGAKMCELDTATITTKNFDPNLTRRLLGKKGHIGFEVHDIAGMGRARWAPGAVCRWKNIRIKEI